MFYVYALASVLGYSLQAALLVRHARTIDGLSLAFYRNISFVVTLSPLLFFGTTEDILVVLANWPWLLLAGIGGGLFLGLVYTAFKYMPMGVTHTINRTTFVILVTIIGITIKGEEFSPAMLLVMAFIVVSALWLGLTRNPMDHLDNNIKTGIGLAICGALPFIMTKEIITMLSRTTNPLVAGYFWEVSIAIGAMVIITIRSLFTKEHIQRISIPKFLDIAACSSLTLVGTGFFTLAVRIGPLAIMETIGAGALAVTALCGYFWYNEKLQAQQWLAICCIVLGIGLMRWVT